METKQIINWLRDKADRADNPSWTRMMHMAAACLPWNGHLTYLDGRILTLPQNASVRLKGATNTQLAAHQLLMVTRECAVSITANTVQI